jgi:hypothetical protein
MLHQNGFNRYARQMAVYFGYSLVDNRIMLSGNLTTYNWGFLAKCSHVYQLNQAVIMILRCFLAMRYREQLDALHYHLSSAKWL